MSSDQYTQLFGKDHIRDGDVIDYAEHGRVGGVDTGQGFKFVQSAPMKIIETVDSGDTTITYYGFAKPGTATSSDLWRILRESTTTGIVDFADSDDSFDNIYDNRESLNYG